MPQSGKAHPRHVIITGGSSGIGLALAKAYGAQGAKISLIARDTARLDAAISQVQPMMTQAKTIAGFSADVTDYQSLQVAIHNALERFGPCDLLITSAGIVRPQVLSDIAPSALCAEIDTNFNGSVFAAHILWRHLSDHGGSILFISSGAALIGLHGYSLYCASKAALINFVEALRMEAKAEAHKQGRPPLHIALCFPPDTDTPQFHEELNHRSPEAARLMGQVKPWTAEKLAQHIIRHMQKRRQNLYFDASLWALGHFGALIRPLLYWWYGRNSAS